MAKQQFYTPICVDNLAQFFALGFITPASTFPFDNYLPDEFCLHPAGVPLYKKPNAKNKIPRKGLNASAQEDSNLKSALVVVSLDMTGLSGNDAGSRFDLDGVIPTYLINEVVFEDEQARDHFDYLTKISGRVSIELLEAIKFKATGFDKLFEVESRDQGMGFDSQQPALDAHHHLFSFDKTTIRKVSGYGAALALCFVAAKNSKRASDAFKQLSALSADSDSPFAVKELLSYLQREQGEELLSQKLRGEFFNVLVGYKGQGKILDNLISFFDMDFDDEKVTHYLQKLKEKSRDIQKGKIQETKAEQLKSFDKVERLSDFISQIVTMFSLLNETEKLFTQPIPTVTDEGYTNIAIAYGLRDKFYEIPKVVRQIKGLEKFVVERMFVYFNQIIGNPSPEKSKINDVPTLIDILSDDSAPQLKDSLASKFDLVERYEIQEVNVNGVKYIPENTGELATLLGPDSKQFAEKMIMQKAFDDVDFNAILELYESEKSLTKAMKKLARDLSKL
ncbi:hypothetical protein K0504_04630 [Neiella marina]|uniref:Uncharacterized protein n=1 Tax=Neiella holothuriorum TaxID=2870530 RepID=A0ABS7EDA8_9GAMM|nr:hypothetical protein [Neiella holothuriorum]MBW8190315.1 hypothetical protein [Neiella holothuriorum]